MSTHIERALDNVAVPQQSRISRFGPEADFEEYELSCQDCIRFVTAVGTEDDARNCARRHLEKSAICEFVTVVYGESGERVGSVEGGSE